MEKNNLIFNKMQVKTYLILLLAVFALSSCLKNGKYATDFSTVGASVDLPLAAANSNNAVPFSFGTGNTTFPVIANMASPAVLGTATTLTLALDSAYLTAYNANNGTSYVLLPDSTYTTSGWSLTIPAGKREDTMLVTFNLNKIDLSQPYVLPVTISSASLPIEQWDHLLIAITVTNQYAGNYNGTGTRYNYTGTVTYTYPGAIPAATSTSDLTGVYVGTTLSASSISLPYANLGPNGYDYVVTMNPDQSIASVVPNATMAAGITGFVVYADTYDATTGTYHFVTGYVNGSGNQRIVDETFVAQ
jgi:hypothetical protein